MAIIIVIKILINYKYLLHLRSKCSGFHLATGQLSLTCSCDYCWLFINTVNQLFTSYYYILISFGDKKLSWQHERLGSIPIPFVRLTSCVTMCEHLPMCEQLYMWQFGYVIISTCINTVQYMSICTTKCEDLIMWTILNIWLHHWWYTLLLVCTGPWPVRHTFGELVVVH